MSRRRLPLLVAALALTAAAASACTDVNGTNGKDYVGGAGVQEIPVADRKAPVEVSGETLTGDRLDLADRRGSVVVVNVWWSGCGPCRVEAPMLTAAADELAGDATIVGIDIRNSKEDGLAFERGLGVTYPSIFDHGSEQLLNFPEPFNPRAMPSTVVLDRQGRVAALIPGQLPSKLTLLEIVKKVAAEDG